MAYSPLPRAAVAFAIAAVAAVTAFGAYLRLVDTAALPFDERWAEMVTVSPGSAPFAVAAFFAEIGTAVGSAALGAVAIALFLVLKRPRDAAAIGTSLLLGVAASELLKAIVFRPRPLDQLYAVHGSSYPSGHSMGAAALAVSVALALTSLERVSARLTWIIAAAWVLLMMWSRTALHVHWLSDTIAGALLGAASALLARALWIHKSPASGRPPLT